MTTSCPSSMGLMARRHVRHCDGAETDDKQLSCRGRTAVPPCEGATCAIEVVKERTIDSAAERELLQRQAAAAEVCRREPDVRGERRAAVHAECRQLMSAHARRPPHPDHLADMLG